MSKWIITKGPSLSDFRDEKHVPNKDRVSYSKSTGKEYNDATELLEDILNMDELKTAYKLRMYLDRASNDSKYWRVTFCFDCLNEIGRKPDFATNNRRIYTATFELNAEPTQKELDGYEGAELDMIDEELQDATADVGLDYQWMNYDVKLEDIFESRLRRGRMLKEGKGEKNMKRFGRRMIKEWLDGDLPEIRDAQNTLNDIYENADLLKKSAEGLINADIYNKVNDMMENDPFGIGEKVIAELGGDHLVIYQIIKHLEHVKSLCKEYIFITDDGENEDIFESRLRRGRMLRERFRRDGWCAPSVSELAKSMKDGVDWLVEKGSGCCHWPIYRDEERGNVWSIVMGWSEYDGGDENVYFEDGYTIRVGIRYQSERNAMQSDYDVDFTIPETDDGDAYDISYSVEQNEDFKKLASDMLAEGKSVVKEWV